MRSIPTALTCLALTAPALADVWKVGGASPDFGSLAAAVAAAGEGDTLLVRSGGLQYAPVLIDGKSLTIVADTAGGARIEVRREIEVRNLAPGQVVVLEGLTIGTQGYVGGPALSIRFCQGSVRVDNGAFRGEWPDLCDSNAEGRPGVYVTQSTDVAFAHCELLGGLGKSSDDNVFCGPNNEQYITGTGGPGGFFRSSTVALFDCLVEGGPGGFPDDGDGVDGGIGLEVRDGSVFLAGCSVVGGPGSDGNFFFPQGCGGSGGTGLELSTAAAEVRVLDSTIDGGPAGFGIDRFTGASCPGAVGPSLTQFPGASFVDLGLTSRSMTISAPVRASDPTHVHFDGLPGDAVFGMLSAVPDVVDPFPQAAGPKLVGPLIRRLPLGTLDAAGQLDVMLFTPPLPPGTENLTWYWQGLVVGTDGQAVVTGTEPWVVVDPTF